MSSPRLLMLTGNILLATATRSQSHVTVIQTSHFSQDAMWISGATTHAAPEERRMMSPRASASTQPTKRAARRRTRRYFSSRARAKHTHIPTTTMPTARESAPADRRRVAWGLLPMDVLGPAKWKLEDGVIFFFLLTRELFGRVHGMRSDGGVDMAQHVFSRVFIFGSSISRSFLLLWIFGFWFFRCSKQRHHLCAGA